VTCNRTSRCRRGFTLLELILAMGVVVALSAAMYASMAVAVRAKRSAEAAVGPSRAAAIAAEVVAQDLASALPPNGVLAGPFYGTTGAVEFYSSAEDAPPTPERTDVLAEGIRRVRLEVSSETSPPSLVRRVERNLLSEVQQTPADEVLCRDVRAFAIRYFDGTSWLEQWDSTTTDNTLPAAVELALTLPVGASRPGETYNLRRVITLSCGGSTLATTSSTTGGTR
jgi:prepilin-type N-terminal cleavage/methylation domain-containing protein